MGNTNKNWEEIQKSHDDGLARRQLMDLYKLSSRSITLAIKRGDLKLRNKKESQVLKIKRYLNTNNVSELDKEKVVNNTHKLCGKCKLVKEVHFFNKRKNGRNPFCAECSRIHSRMYYASNKEKHKKETRKRTRVAIFKKRERIAQILKSGCVDCGIKNILVLEFDHLIPSEKETEVSKMISLNRSWKRIEAEISKCVIRCSNCHRVRTAKDQKSWRLKYID